MAEIHLDASDPTAPLLTFNVDGLAGKVDLSKVNRIVVDFRPGVTVPVLVLEVPFAGELDIPVGKVIEQVASPASPPFDFLAQFRDFLEQLDPATIEQAVLAQSEGLGGKSTGECILDAFKEMARERGNDSRT